MIADASAINAASTTELARRDGVDVNADTPTEVTRRAEEQVEPSGQSVVEQMYAAGFTAADLTDAGFVLHTAAVPNPDEELERRLAQHRLGMAEPATEPRTLMPNNSAQRTPVPPSSFGSANSHAPQSFYTSGAEPPQEVPALEAGEPEHIEPSGLQPDAELKTQLLKAIASNEELARAVTDLQLSVSNLEVQVSDLQLQLQYHESNQDSNQTRFFKVHTPRMYPEQDPLEGWYGNAESQRMPPRVPDLTAQWPTPRPGLANPDSHVTPCAAESRLPTSPEPTSANDRCDVRLTSS